MTPCRSTSALLRCIAPVAVLFPLLSGCGGADAPADAAATATDSRAMALAMKPRPARLKVQVSVAATDPNGRPLTYRWRSSDGAIADVDAPTTSWTLADGPGLHFAYVLVSNGAGGYTERRAAVSTDAIGTPVIARAPERYRPPPAGLPVGEVYRTFAESIANVPDIAVVLQDTSRGLRFPATGTAVSDLRGQVIIPHMLPVPQTDPPMEFACASDPLGTLSGCGFLWGAFGEPWSVPTGVAVTDYLEVARVSGYTGSPVTEGLARLADGSPCGAVNEYFDVKTTGTATLVDAAGLAIQSARLSVDGGYRLPHDPNAAAVVLKCEEAAPVRLEMASANEFGGFAPASFSATAQPVVDSMAVTLNGNVIGALLAPPSQVPSDVVPDPDRFLSYKGIDSREDACAYYQAIGAARGCDAKGQLIDPITFDDWKRSVRIGPYAVPGVPEYSARYINKADLNLARNHHSISYGPQRTAAYVCNHLGPQVLDPDQAEIDRVIDNMVQGKNLVACVAMDYSATPRVNRGAPFVRFLTFGPNGQLLASVNLDGRREKFVPGTCVACHGGDHYAGHFGADGRADVGAHFLPYDTGNFEFSSQPGLTESDQQAQLFGLNQNVLKAGPTPAAQELIAGWYASGATALDKTYLPLSWRDKGQLSADFYRDVVAKSCRGCHVNLPGYDFDHYENMTSHFYRGTGPDFTYTVGCTQGNSFRGHSMPNSLVTFNRFWNSAGAPTDQTALLNSFITQVLGDDEATLTCAPPALQRAAALRR